MTWKKNRKVAFPTIVRVDALDSDCFDVTLSNGHAIILEFRKRATEPFFAEVIQSGLFDKPQTDGRRLYWINGPSYTVEDILTILAFDN